MQWGVILVLYTALVDAKQVVKNEKKTIVLLSFDGFRHDYVERENLVRFKEFAGEGVKADSLRSTFVTKTFPNHFTIVTGLYEESHGIVANQMFDPQYNEYFDPSKSNDPKWWNATKPIWILNEKQFSGSGKQARKSATIFWPGSQTSYDGYMHYYTEQNYNTSFTFVKRMDKVVDLLLEPDPVNFVACYFEEPDRVSHSYGTDHSKTRSVLKKLDLLLGYFIDKMKKASLYNKVNIIIVSDHGMKTIEPKNVRTLTEYVQPHLYDVINYGAFLHIRPKAGYKEEIYRNLSRIDKLTTYKREDLPTEWHYKSNRRIPEIVAVADEGYYISPNSTHTERVTMRKTGDHGYDNKLASMHGIFLARGPSFKSGYLAKELQNIDICALMCHVLQLTPHAQNGSLERIKHVLAEKTLFSIIQNNPVLTTVLLSVCALFVVAVCCACSVSCFSNLKASAKYKNMSQENVPLAEWRDEDSLNWTRD